MKKFIELFLENLFDVLIFISSIAILLAFLGVIIAISFYLFSVNVFIGFVALLTLIAFFMTFAEGIT